MKFLPLVIIIEMPKLDAAKPHAAGTMYDVLDPLRTITDYISSPYI